MCGRARLSSDVSEIKLVFSIPPHWPTPSWNVAPTGPLPVGWVRQIKPDERETIIGRRPGQRMRRRELMLLLGGGLTMARPLRAQQKAMPVIGVLGGGSPHAFAPFVAAFREGLVETGYVEGRNVALEHRWAEGRYDQLPAMAADLASHKVDVIVAMGGTPSALAAKSATSTIPVVFLVSDPVASGLVVSLARPGGNLTGVDMFTLELMAKRLELLSELVPQGRGIALLVNPNTPITQSYIRNAQEAARAKEVQLHILKAGTESEIDAAFATLVLLHADALIVVADPFLDGRREQLVTQAARYAIPTIYALREFAVDGGLISYGASFRATFRLSGIYAGKILHGAKPADLPVQQPTKFELVVNLKTAKALGLTVPPSILARADEVIE
jgi:putative tryptophan/tyrosine transport system substrate-binding protein